MVTINLVGGGMVRSSEAYKDVTQKWIAAATGAGLCFEVMENRLYPATEDTPVMVAVANVASIQSF